ncbi:MAG: archaeosortase A [Candidatus Thermoplasmatota archaeon]|nr:archaeosortase A [Candidatus Thermoplasmatota archaeon]
MHKKDLYYVTCLFGGATLALIIGHFIFLALLENYPLFNSITLIFLFLSLIMLAIGLLSKRKSRHFLMAMGWIIFAVYWATQPEFLYYKEDGDIVNAIICILGVYFLFYIGYHEYLSYKRNEELNHLTFIAGATFISAFFYFLIDKLPVLSGALIKMVAEQTVWVMKAIGYDVATGAISYGKAITVPVYFNGNHSVQLILACTGLQSMMIFIGVIAALKGVDWRRRFKAFMLTIPVIYALNIVRNVGVIYGVEVRNYTFYFMHNVVGKIGSLLVLIILAYLTFEILPELYDNISSLFELPKRKGPIERVFSKLLRTR